MPKELHDYLVFVLRGQPFHYGHASVILEGLRQSKHVIILIGSADSAINPRNPFTYEERARMVQDWYNYEGIQSVHDANLRTGAHQILDAQGGQERLIILPLKDHLYNDDAWLEEVQNLVNGAVQGNERGWKDYPPKVGLIGHSKDQTSYYLQKFPQWGNIDVPAFTDRHLCNATEVRDIYFGKTRGDEMAEIAAQALPDTTIKFLDEYDGSKDFRYLYNWHRYVEKYKEDHGFANPDLPYEGSHATVDAVVLCAGHVLLGERRAMPGKGQWALPGGFINPGEAIKAAMVRELTEETCLKLKVPVKAITGNIKAFWVFDDAYRSTRGRVYSNCFGIRLDPDPKGLPKVRGRSDFAKAWWQPLSELDPKLFFEDHYHIIQKMRGKM
jgi:bifunctional NMN adenylyltransferase/nudix hydrolase